MTCHVRPRVCVRMCVLLPASYPTHHLCRSSQPLPSSCFLSLSVPFFFSFFGSLPFQEAVKTVWISYVTARITVAPRYHVWSQLAQRLRLMWHRDSLLFFFLERMQLINCPHFIKWRPRFYCHSCSCWENWIHLICLLLTYIVMYCTFIVVYTAALASLRGL